MFVNKYNFIKIILALVLVAVITFLISLNFGSVNLNYFDLFYSLDSLTNNIFNLRLNRSVNAFGVGALLAIAGVMMQVLLRNPLAEPYILGISGGASIGALSAISLGLSTFWLNSYAFIGSILSIMLVFNFSIKNKAHNPTKLLLTGVVLAAAYTAIIKLLLVFSNSNELKSMVFWLMGDLSAVELNLIPIYILAITLIIAIIYSRQINILMLGENKAKSLGINVAKLRIILFILASLTTAISITSAGVIGFVGLIIPHSLRFMKIVDHRLLLPASAFVGGSFLLVADSIARSLFSPSQLPVGVITTLIGVPIFIYLLRK